MLVRSLGPEDIAFAARLSRAEGWGITAQELQRLLELEPSGSFIAEEEGEPVGMIVSVVYGKVGWVSHLIVTSASRRRGHGRALLEAAVGRLLDQGVRTVGVHVVLQAVPFYAQAGFRPGYELLYMRRGALAVPSLVHDAVGPLEETDLHAVAMFDWACFGGCRRRALRSLLASSEVAFLAQDAEGLAGYLMARCRDGQWTIGPWVCTRSAEALLTRALAAIGAEPVRLAVPKVNEQALATLRKHGFTVYYHEMRMYHGDQEGMGHPERIYAIASPEKG